jgi:hypothetical protein
MDAISTRKHDIRALRLHARLVHSRALHPQEDIYEVIEGELEVAIA